MKNLKFIGTLTIVAVAVTTMMSSCDKSKTADKAVADTDSASIAKVRVLQAQEREIEQIVSFTTTVLPEAKNSIAPQTPGRIREIFVEVGNRVVKGQKLVQMDAVQQNVLKTQVDNLQEMYNRVEQLFDVGGASKQDLDNARTQLDVAKTNLNNAQENTYLLSPLTGVVTARNYDDGDLFNGQVAVLTVMQINPVKLTINISESYFPQIKLGMAVDVKFDVFANEKFTGKIGLIYPTIDPTTRTFSTDITMSNPSGKIRPGMFGRVYVNFGKQKQVVVSDKSVIKQQGTDDRYVYILKTDNTVNYRRVELGTRIGNEYAILSGIENGEKVVVDGLAGLLDGKKVVLIDN
ncbi:MAG: efflux RND transporter periplasmic adaptor subunit [Prevotellaceae bacterium]|jgi:RND family efflux transporter MFP subunit|nr:efflux RND transporter periplasmic adaptor subunit [Prevotellaceae bacterium]